MIITTNLSVEPDQAHICTPEQEAAIGLSFSRSGHSIGPRKSQRQVISRIASRSVGQNPQLTE